MSKNTVASIVARMRCGFVSLQIAALIGLSACGGSGSPTAEPGDELAASSSAPAADPAPEKPGRGAQEPNSVVNSLSFAASGDAEGALESDGTDLMLTGGCLDRSVIGMSFTRGQVTDKDLFQVSLRTADSVAAGETGEFPVSELGWYDGQVKPENLPPGVNVLVPNAYEGSGTLTLTRHDGGGLNGRMVGTVEGTVKQSGGDNEAVIVASFDINLGCTYTSLDGMN